jgi:hypothetical protein
MDKDGCFSQQLVWENLIRVIHNSNNAVTSGDSIA